MEYHEIIEKLEALENPKNVAGMARFGIRPKTKVLGVPVPEVRKLAKIIKKDSQAEKIHKLALTLWEAKIHEARVLASMIADPKKLTEKQMQKWASGFDSWDVCDQCCMNLFWKTDFAYKKVFDFAKSDKEFIKRTAFSLIASLASHNKTMTDKDFEKFFEIIKKASTDERNFVKKAVNWALRQIGKRNLCLNKKAIKVAREILKTESKSANWVAGGAIRELESDAVQKRLAQK